MGAADLDAILAILGERGVAVVDPRQTYVAPDVDPQRVCAGATLHPGTRLSGPRTFIGPNAQVGSQGPATIVDGVLGPGARLDAGYLEGAVLLDGARVGWGGHVRPGTLLEEGASTAHCVGLKHTILMSFVTVGSVVNLCDLLMAGGTSPADHSEVGSGFIHFNFTPWGERGDKATPSLVGDVVRGALIRAPRIFLGGAGGMVGPRKVGFGAISGAGQVLRSDVGEGQLSLQPVRPVRRAIDERYLDAVQPRLSRNLQYVAQVVALRCWYREVRLARASGEARTVLGEAIDVLGLCIEERIRRLTAFAAERGAVVPTLDLDIELPVPPELPLSSGPAEHVAWVRALTDAQAAAAIEWLTAVAAAVCPEPDAA
ncbi:MAG: UDP-N-acetylglucosamine pyrophosphorylase [Myxococcota bacterium]